MNFPAEFIFKSVIINSHIVDVFSHFIVKHFNYLVNFSFVVDACYSAVHSSA